MACQYFRYTGKKKKKRETHLNHHPQLSVHPVFLVLFLVLQFRIETFFLSLALLTISVHMGIQLLECILPTIPRKHLFFFYTQLLPISWPCRWVFCPYNCPSLSSCPLAIFFILLSVYARQYIGYST